MSYRPNSQGRRRSGVVEEVTMVVEVDEVSKDGGTLFGVLNVLDRCKARRTSFFLEQFAMGKWNYRRRWTPRNYYRDQRIPSPPTYYDTEFKLRGAWKNVDLPWEERFCISVGIPWEKVVNAKKYMHCYDNVVKWNDSAGEEAFCDAKKRFWAEINGIPADVPQPDPDMYTNEIDWNPDIDLELVKDLDLAYFNPDETERVENFDAAKKNVDSWVPGCILGLDDKNLSNMDDPWERSKNANLYNKTDGWNCSNNSVNKNISDPWERGATQDDREIKDIAWRGGGSSSWHKDNTWGGGARNSGNNEITWGGGANNSWHHNQHPVQNDTWASVQRTDGSVKETGWGSNRNSYGRHGYVSTSRGSRAPSRQRGDYRHTSFGREQWHDVGHNGSGWESNVSCRKREGPQQYASTYKSARLQSDDYREGNRYWR